MNVTQFRKLILPLALCLVALIAATVTPRMAFAHADYERSEPNADAVVDAPTQVSIWFTQDLFRRKGENRIEVFNEAGERVDQDDATIDDDNRRLMRVSLPAELAPGLYTVRWYTLSSDDGHNGEGEFAFTVGAAQTTAEPSTGTTTITATDTVTSTDAVTSTDTVTDTLTESATGSSTSEGAAPVPSPTEAPTEPTAEAAPTAAPSSTPAFPCVGGAVPLAMMLGMVWIGHRRTPHLHKRARLWPPSRSRADKKSAQPLD